MNSAVFNMLWSTMAYPREPQPERGFSVLGIVLRYYGLPDVTDVLGDIALQELGKDVHAATDLDAMASTAEWLGFNAKMSQPTRLDPAELPVIVKHRGGRFLLVFGLEDGEILAVDPARGLVNQKESAFTREWRREALFISPTPAALSAQKLGELAETIRADCHRQDLIREYRATAVAQGTYGLIFRERHPRGGR